MRIIFPLITLVLYSCGTKTQEELSSSGLLLPIVDSVKVIPLEPGAPQSLQHESFVDLSESMPPAGEQGQQASCVGWCIGYYVLSYYEKWKQEYSYQINNARLDSTKVFSPSFVYNAVKLLRPRPNCKTGIAFKSAFDFVEKQGVCRLNFYPYSGDAEICPGKLSSIAKADALRFRGYQFFRVPKDINTLLSHIESGEPIIIGIFTSKGLYDAGKNHTKGQDFLWSPRYRDRHEYHAMLIVGYNDKLKRFKLLNSWGSDWGSNGYVWIDYKRLLERSLEYYVCQPPSSNIEAINPVNYNLHKITTNHFIKTFPSVSSLNFERYSINLSTLVNTTDSVRVAVFDSAYNNFYHFNLQGLDTANIFFRDTLIQISARLKNNTKSVVFYYNFGIQSDSTVYLGDSIMADHYNWLQSQKNLSVEDRQFIREYKFARSKYIETEFLKYKRVKIEYYWLQSLIIFLISVGLFFGWRILRKWLLKARKRI